MDLRRFEKMAVAKRLREGVRLPVSTIYESLVVQPRIPQLPKQPRPINCPPVPPKSVGAAIPNPAPPSVATTRCDCQGDVAQVERPYLVHRSSDVYNGRRILMRHLGLDIGTKTISVAYRDDANSVNYISEINGYWPFERSTPFIRNMLDDPTKTRSDGTKRPARWVEMPSTGEAIVLGQDAEEFAFAKNDTLRRPMAEGGIASDEEAITILSTIVQGILEAAEKEIGQFGDSLKICYCTTAPALNKDINIAYHERVVNIIIDGYETKAKITHGAIKESHAIVIDMSEDGTGIGISWGAGTVTVSYVKYGLEIYSFSWVGAGDWIDEQVAMRHGYDPFAAKTRRRIAKETPTTVSKRKQTIDLTPGSTPDDRVGVDIVLHYDVLISTVINGIIKGFVDNETEARIAEAINVYMAGGSSIPKGFTKRVAKKFDEIGTPFEIGKVTKSDRPLYCVATGCLIAAENGIVG